MADKLKMNWKTTFAGCIVMAAGVYQIMSGDQAGIGTVVAGAGLLAAKDGL